MHFFNIKNVFVDRGASEIAPAISMCSSAEDMAVWVKVLLNEGKNDEGEQVLPADVIKECFRPQVSHKIRLDSVFQMSANKFMIVRRNNMQVV